MYKRQALDGTQLLPRTDAAVLEGEALGALARAYLLSEAVIRRVTDFIDGDVLHALLAHDIAVDTSSEAATRDSAERIATHLSSEVRIESRFDDKHERWMLVVLRMRHGNLRTGRIDEDFLLSGDYVQIRRTAQMISGLMGEGATIRRGDKTLVVSSFAEAMRWMLSEVERGLGKQRYKGLGEMNPMQLWETTMDPAVRRLLRVQIDDCLLYTSRCV